MYEVTIEWIGSNRKELYIVPTMSQVMPLIEEVFDEYKYWNDTSKVLEYETWKDYLDYELREV